MARGEPGFLCEFALSRGQRLFAGIDASGGEFPELALSGVAILMFEQYLRFGRALAYGHDHDRAGVMHNDPMRSDSVGFQDVVVGNPEYGSLVNNFRGDEPLLLGRLRLWGA